MTESTSDSIELTAPLSFWGGYDPRSGRIIDPFHPQYGDCVTGKVLRMQRSRGSTSSPGALLESLRLGTGPSAFILGSPDVVVLTAAHLARVLYGIDVRVQVING